ncbi:hypothetical protein [Paenibacillus shenyangensis]|uniref:hypothetical protein n=1 Tax=Paenibacillus sp. A9 TaxID=1284352 RepID=UPI000376E55B|nr:hypothetical protein [Paenibacillus sp. A9]
MSRVRNHVSLADHASYLVSEIWQRCNGLLPVEWLLGDFTRRTEYDAVLMTAVDFWALPAINQFTCSPGFDFGDGGAAWVISRGKERARIEGMAYRTGAHLVGKSRGDELHGPRSRLPVDFGRRSQEFGRGTLSADKTTIEGRRWLVTVLDARRPDRAAAS